MPRPTEREIEESYDRAYGLLDDQDEDLIRHIFFADAPKQGLHQHGEALDHNIKE